MESKGVIHVMSRRNLVKLPEGAILKTCPAGPIPDTTTNTATTTATTTSPTWQIMQHTTSPLLTLLHLKKKKKKRNKQNTGCVISHKYKCEIQNNTYIITNAKNVFYN